MAEIKSALELAMEKSNRFAISDRERDEFKRKEVEQKTAALFHRYLDGNMAIHEVLKEIERADEKARPVMKEVLLSRWIDALGLQEEDERLLKGIEALKGRELGLITERLIRLSRSHSEESDEARGKVRDEAAAELRSMGIYGTAVEPNTTESRRLQTLLAGIEHRYKEQLLEVKAALRKL
jgi:hypothetical protein